jgi:hypothetical protein
LSRRRRRRSGHDSSRIVRRGCRATNGGTRPRYAPSTVTHCAGNSTRKPRASKTLPVDSRVTANL